jgi:Cu-Zn family superoxide dismutase
MAGCGRPAAERTPQNLPRAEAPEVPAVVFLEGKSGQNVRGTIRFTREAEGIRVAGEIEGLQPGEHGFHIHEKGDCSSPNAESAGAHWDPAGEPHGGRDADRRHAGDLGNITADASGRARVDFVDARLVHHGLATLVGLALVVHSARDDLASQPAGNAGARVACGRIEREMPIIPTAGGQH